MIAVATVSPRRLLTTRASVLRIGVVSDAAPGSRAVARRNGLLLGLEEAKHAAALFGGDIALVPLSGAAVPASVAAVIGGQDALVAARIAAATAAQGVIYVNVSDPADALRGAGCRPTTFHVAPSDAMVRDARSQAGPRAAADAVVTAWTPALTKYGADTLNERFHSRFGAEMTADAWTAWVAVKILWEASLRARSVAPAPIRAYLERDAAQFDGHKGRPLSFRAWDHQLRQPLYVLPNGKKGGTPQSKCLCRPTPTPASAMCSIASA